MAAGTSGYNLAVIAQVFSNRNYAIYTAGNSISLIGLWVQRLGVGWLAWELTHSGFWLGAVAFADLFPVVVIGLFGGVLADRHDRRKILMAGQSLALVQACTLWGLTLLGTINIGTLFGLSLFLGVVVAFVQPARLSMVPSLVREGDVAGAVAIGAVIFNLARFVGPALAGVLIHMFGIATAFAFNAVTFSALIVALLFIRLGPHPGIKRARTGVFREAGSGLSYAFSHPAIAPLLMLMVAVSLLTRPALELLPAFVDAVFSQGPGGLAVLTSAVGLGALAAGLWLAQRGSAVGFSTISLVATAVGGLSVIVFSLTTNLWAAAPALAVTGFAIAVVGITSQTLIQAGVEGHMRGRVLSIWGLILRGVPALGALGMGWVSDLVGLKPPVAVASILCVGAALVLWRGWRRQIVALEASA
jgi:MFS family permease